MASTPPSLAILFIVVALLAIHAHGAAKDPPVAPGPSAVAPGPTPAPLNLTLILEKGSQFTTLIRLLKETQIGGQIDSQLNNSFVGLTLFAPTDNAFNSLKPGTLNSLTSQQQVALILYHVLPRYYSAAMFETTSNPVTTQATGNDGIFTVNITSTSHQVNISTGVNQTPINHALYTTFPLAVYEIDSVLLPYDLFGPKRKRHVAAAPPELSTKANGTGSTAPSTEAATQTANSGNSAGIVGWFVGIGLAVGMMGLS